jgi:hypothetical protein
MPFIIGIGMPFIIGIIIPFIIGIGIPFIIGIIMPFIIGIIMPFIIGIGMPHIIGIMSVIRGAQVIVGMAPIAGIIAAPFIIGMVPVIAGIGIAVIIVALLGRGHLVEAPTRRRVRPGAGGDNSQVRGGLSSLRCHLRPLRGKRS